MTTPKPKRLPQRFMYRHADRWRFGVCVPHDGYWMIRAEVGHGTFDDDPWEVMGQVIGDVFEFVWIDADYGWAGDVWQHTPGAIAEVARCIVSNMESEQEEGCPSASLEDRIRALAAALRKGDE